MLLPILFFLCVARLDALNLTRVGPVPGTYNVALTDDVVGCDTTGTNSPVINLPAAATLSGYTVTIADETNNAATEAITINTYGSDTIDNFPSPWTIMQNGMSLSLYADGGTNWVITARGLP